MLHMLGYGPSPQEPPITPNPLPRCNPAAYPPTSDATHHATQLAGVTPVPRVTECQLELALSPGEGEGTEGTGIRPAFPGMEWGQAGRVAILHKAGVAQLQRKRVVQTVRNDLDTLSALGFNCVCPKDEVVTQQDEYWVQNNVHQAWNKYELVHLGVFKF